MIVHLNHTGAFMKCPKCKYSTFDFVDTCPKCGKNLASEKAKLNILSIKPNPPSVLGSLTGDLNELGNGVTLPDSARRGAEDMELAGDEIYDDGSELDINIEEELLSESDESADLDLGNLESSNDGDDLEIDFSADNGLAPEKPTLRNDESEDNAEDAGVDSDDGELELDLEEDEDSEK
jgi:hypothetical protein